MKERVGRERYCSEQGKPVDRFGLEFVEVPAGVARAAKRHSGKADFSVILSKLQLTLRQ
jgi:hypothetical protein